MQREQSADTGGESMPVATVCALKKSQVRLSRFVKIYLFKNPIFRLILCEVKPVQAVRIVCLLCVSVLPAVVQAQFTYTTNNDGTLNISGYSGSGGAVIIPGTNNDLLVTSIGDSAFSGFGLTSVTIPDTVTSIGDEAFLYCQSLSAIYFQGNKPSLGANVFGAWTFPAGFIYPPCYYLPGTTGWGSTLGDCQAFLLYPPFICTTINSTITIDSYTGSDSSLKVPEIINGLPVTRIESQAFFANTSLISITIPNSVGSIGYQVFGQCTALKSVYFNGNAPATDTPPSYDETEFSGDNNVTAYYLPGTIGWGTVFGDGPTADGGGSQGGAQTELWLPSIEATDTYFGVLSNQFGFNINWAGGETVVVEACTNIGNPVWSAVATNTFTTGTSYFSDSQWTNYPSRFYRIRSP